MPDWVAYGRILNNELQRLSIEPTSCSKTAPIFILRNPGPISAAADAFCSHIRACIGSPPVWERELRKFEKSKRIARRL